MDNEVFFYPFTVKEHHLDSFGHVNNATYLELYEEARWELIHQKGYGIKDLEEHKKGPVILEVNVKFKKELLCREKVIIRTQTTRMKKGLMYIEQQMIKEATDEIASTALFTIGFFDLVARKLIEPPKEWLQAIGVREAL